MHNRIVYSIYLVASYYTDIIPELSMSTALIIL